MITKYFNTVVVKYNPLLAASKPARIFLANIPPAQRQQLTLTHRILEPNSTEPASITVTFKDGNTISVDPTSGSTVGIQDVFDRYSRKLKLKEDISDE
ncbi:similar to Saccharomyces cerevisiae YMR225C MRPL44 Mitochondrial ribosomal protein of the large subunit [Geotrichum candidum]|uniref:Large ribosomal subunit protein mL53 n=1 Tax=Geotrichum candidum TaxID=1173061 RepID=A0A0J9XCN0_GEOCN|nr:similar to Saccharomyces cerevisiae YMR225C MRPL44 Mitochondrial ribosomal protein of the large subunit [Geotrichum candidum]